MPDALILVHTTAHQALLASAPAGARVIAVAPVVTPAHVDWLTPNAYLNDTEYSEIEFRSVDWLKRLAHKRHEDGRSLVSSLQVGKVSLWWFIEAHFHRYYFKAISRHVVWLQRVLAAERPTALHLIDDGSVLAATACAVAQSMGIRVQAISPGGRDAVDAPQPSIHRALRSSALHARDVARRVSNFGLSFRTAPPRGLKLLVSSMSREQVTSDPLTGRQQHEDLMLGTVLRSLTNDERISSVLLYKFPASSRVRVPAGISAHGRVVRTWEQYSTPTTVLRIQAIINAATDARVKLWRSMDFQASWTFDGVELWPVVMKPLEERWAWELRLAARYLVLAESVLDHERPDAVLMAGEASIDNKALVSAARLRGIPVIAVQHGNIPATDDYLSDFRFHADDFQGTPSKAFLFPDRLCISGQDTKQALVEQIRYPYPARLTVTGQPRLDPLFEPARYFNRERFMRAFGLDPARKLIVIGSQTFHMAGNRAAFCGAILRALRDATHLEIVIKPHPLEGAEWHRAFAATIGTRVTVLPQNTSMQEALHACDLLITFYSTIATEAMILGRPVMIVNLTGRPAPVPYAEQGAALGVYCEEDILPRLQQILGDEDLREHLRRGAATFVAREAFGHDGRATDRVLSVVRTLAGETVPPPTTTLESSMPHQRTQTNVAK